MGYKIHINTNGLWTGTKSKGEPIPSDVFGGLKISLFIKRNDKIKKVETRCSCYCSEVESVIKPLVFKCQNRYNYSILVTGTMYVPSLTEMLLL